MLFMCATSEEVGASRSENGIGEKSRKDKTCFGNDGPEATTYSALTVESLDCQEAVNVSRKRSMIVYTAHVSIVDLVACRVPQI